MLDTNRTVMICVVLLCAVALYKVGSGDAPIIENFWGGLPLMFPAVDTVDASGNSVPKNNLSQLYFSHDPVNTSMMTPSQKQFVASSLAPPGSAAHQQFLAASGQTKLSQERGSCGSAAQGDLSSENLQVYSCGSTCQAPPSRQPAGRNMVPPTYTVPGTYQGPLSPRFNSEGLNSFVKYNLPEEKHLANRANDPLMMADVVEKPIVREGYEADEKFVGNTPYHYNEIYQKQKKQGDEVANKLPVPTMTSGQGKEAPSTYWTADRFIVALNKSRLAAAGDFFRGDLPCVPCPSSPNASDCVWFRPSVNVARDLRAGAVNVVSGIGGNTTALQLLELQSRGTGGAKSTFGGIAFEPPVNTPVANVQAAQRAQLDRLNMGNQVQFMADASAPLSTVSATMFP